MKVLMTGFEAFHEHRENPTQRLLQQHGFGSDVEVVILPVAFGRAWENLETKIRAQNWDAVIMLGLAADRKEVCLELIAINGISNKKADNDGEAHLFRQIDDKGEAALLSQYPLHSWEEEARSKQLPIRVSLSAGSFVCNYVYYKARQITTKALFVHVPLEEVLPLEKMAECVRWVIARAKG